MAALLYLALAFAQPLPAANDVAAQQRATQCIFYFRLQITGVAGGAAACERDGYGLEFMAAHWQEIEEVERQHQAELDAKIAHARAVRDALAHKDELRGPCEALVLDGGPGPDGGQALCDLAGFDHDFVTRGARRASALRELERGRQLKKAGIVACGALGLLALVGTLVALRQRRG